MCKYLGTVATAVLASVITAWVVADIPNLPAAGARAADARSAVRSAVTPHIVWVTIIGGLVFLASATYGFLALTGRISTMMGAPGWVGLLALGSILVVGACWTVVQEQPVAATLCSTGAAWAVTATVRS